MNSPLPRAVLRTDTEDASAAFARAIRTVRYEDIPRRVPDITRMREILHCEPKTSLEEGLRAQWEWARSYTSHQ